MKTTIKSLIITCTLGLAAVANTQAATSIQASALPETRVEAKAVNVEEQNATELDKIELAFDYQKEAQLMIKDIADAQEAKTIQMLMDRNTEFSAENTDFRTEAQLEIKAIADHEEAIAVQKLIDEGKIAVTR